MLRYILSRVIGLIGVTLVVSFLAFMLLYQLPGGPFSQEKQPLSPAAMAAIKAKYNLDKPFYVVWLSWVGRAVQGDFGYSYSAENVPITKLFADHWAVSLQLGGLALAWSVPLGILLGVLAAVNRNRWADYLLRFLAIVGTTVPSFALVVFLVFVFAVQLRWLPTTGWKPVDDPRTLILPVLIFGLVPFGTLLRYTRNGMIEAMSTDYVRTARAKGLEYGSVVLRHALRNVLIPVVTVLAPMIPNALTGSAILEIMYSINGIGRFFIDSIQSRDYPLALASAFIVATLWGFSYLLTDLAYTLIDPRIRLSGR
ncbi:MAG: ABC transporter permease [Thermoflexales bacterium]